ncbi:MAG: methyltransferase domain-containing protein [Natrialbaceae archaeon]|nr:methyltransferase domain-containing protein [Natrialbaceae archaeon]
MSPPVLLVHEDREYLVTPGEELGTDLGVLEVPADPEPGTTIETHLGEPFTVRALRGPDLFHHLERTGAPMLPRDIGLLIGETGVSIGDRVLDVGTGTGILAAYLGRTGATVITYEQDDEFADVARANLEQAGVSDRVEVRTADATSALDSLSQGAFDVITLDTADAPAIVEASPGLLADGGFIAAYSPFVEAARSITETARAQSLEDIRTLETIQREMTFDERGSRPSTAPVGHTGYLTIARYRA